MEIRILLREENTIRENIFSYNKEFSMEKEFYEAKFSYKRKNTTMRRKFYFGKRILL